MKYVALGCLTSPDQANCCKYYGPDYELDVRSSNMENANSYEYLEKIKIAVIENLKKTAPVPSVQMQDVPRDGFGMSDEQEAELDDLDEDENQDVRMTQRQWEKRVERQDEFEESDDEDMARSNGVYKTNGRSRQETNYATTAKADDAMEVDSGVATPAEPAAEKAADNDDTMIDEARPEGAQAEAETEAPAATVQNAEGGEPKVDDDGDVDMGEAAPEDKTTETTIKKEEVEGISATETEHDNASAAPANDGAGKEEADITKRASGSPEASDAQTKPVENAPATETPDGDATATATTVDKEADNGEAKA